MDAIQIGARLRSARLEKGFTQEDLARLVDVRMMAISRSERGVSIPRIDTMVRIADALDVSPGWLMTGEGPHEAMVRQGDEDLELRDSEAL